MPLPPTNLNLLSTIQATSAAPIKLSLGQSLLINVTQIKDNQFQFNLGGQTFTANTKSPLTETGQIRVTVQQVSPNLIFAAASTKSAPAAQQPQQQFIQNILRQLLPSQLPINQALQQLTQPALMQQLPPAIQAQLTSLFEQFFKPNAQLSAKELRTQIQNSGLFLENRLKQDPKLVQHDLKAKLLQLNQQISQHSQTNTTASKLSAILGQAINKITVQQINLYENPALFNLQLPLAADSQIQKIQIEFRKSQQSKSQQTEVIVDLTLDIGEMSTKIVLDNDTLSAYIWANTPELEKMISQHLNNLRESFQQAGLSVKNLLLSKTKPESSAQTSQIGLIDLHI